MWCRAYLLLGADVKKPSVVNGHSSVEFPGHHVSRQARGGGDRGNATASGRGSKPERVGQQKGFTAPWARSPAPDVPKAILATRKPDLNAVDANGLTAMHYALRFGQPRDVTARMIKDAGFDIVRWRKSLRREPATSTRPPSTRSASAAATASRRRASCSAAPRRPQATPAPAPRATAIDWKALGPYPSRSRTEATRALARPGTDTTVDEHFWDAVSRLEPQRLAIALQARANVRQTRPATGYTPLLVLAERCDLNDQPDAQVSIAEQLIAAGADLTGLDPNKANALIVGADDCPIGVIRALIKAGMPLQAVSATKSTALQAAIYDSRVDVVEVLLDAGSIPERSPTTSAGWRRATRRSRRR